MVSTPAATSGWTTQLVPADDDGCRFFLDKYKPFRLNALLNDPDAFGSTYEREIAFNDQDWLRRVQNKLAKTFVAVSVHDNTILSATSLLGPLPNPVAPPVTLSCAPNSHNVPNVVPKVHPSLTIYAADGDGGGSNQEHDQHGDAATPFVFELGGVYTVAGARGLGLGRALMRLALEEAHRQALEAGRPLRLQTTVYENNHDAIAFYQRCGFVASSQGSQHIANPLKSGPQADMAQLEMFWEGSRV